MRLVFVFYDRPNYAGGPIVNARRLLPELRRRGQEVHCLMLYEGDAAPGADYLEARGVKCHCLPRNGYTESQVLWILNKAAELQPDVFVPNSFVSGWFAARWVRAAGIPTVAVMRSDDPFHSAMIEDFVVGAAEWAVSGLVCVSEHLCRRVQKKRPTRTKLCVIPSGVPVSTATSDQAGPLNLAYVGRLVQEQKRALALIDALALVLRTYGDVTATLIGDGDQRAAVERRIEDYGLAARIKVLGTVPCEDIQAKLLDYDVLVLLSDYEGMPGSVMDGMAAGLVPVCLDIPGVRELVIHERTGLLVKDRKGDFASAIGRIAGDSALRKRLSVNAKEHVKRGYSLESAADRWEQLCRDLISEAGPRSRLSIPGSVSLPPLRPEFAREDRRRRSLLRRVLSVANLSFRLTQVQINRFNG